MPAVSLWPPPSYRDESAIHRRRIVTTRVQQVQARARRKSVRVRSGAKDSGAPTPRSSAGTSGHRRARSISGEMARGSAGQQPWRDHGHALAATRHAGLRIRYVLIDHLLSCGPDRGANPDLGTNRSGGRATTTMARPSTNIATPITSKRSRRDEPRLGTTSLPAPAAARKPHDRAMPEEWVRVWSPPTV